MKKEFKLYVTLAVAQMLLAGCSDQDSDTEYVKRCIDKTKNVVVVDKLCDCQDKPCSSPSPGNSHFNYGWYYGGTGIYIGQRVLGGAYKPASGKTYINTYTHSQRYQSGGFGKTGGFHLFKSGGG